MHMHALTLEERPRQTSRRSLREVSSDAYHCGTTSWPVCPCFSIRFATREPVASATNCSRKRVAPPSPRARGVPMACCTEVKPPSRTRVPAGAVSTCDERACQCKRVRAETCEAPRLVEQPWPQPCQRVELAAVEEPPAALQARLLGAPQARALQVGGEPQVVGCARADADSHAWLVDVDHRVQAAVGKDHVGRLYLCIWRCERYRRLVGLGANQADVPLVAIRGVAKQPRVGVWHELQRHSNALSQRCRHNRSNAVGLTVWTTRAERRQGGSWTS